MSTFTDGAPPSVAPDPDRAHPAGAGQDGANPGAAPDAAAADAESPIADSRIADTPNPGSPNPDSPTAGAGTHAPEPRGPDAEKAGPTWLQEEIQRRTAAMSSASGGRHARRGEAASSLVADSNGYVPRHSVAAQDTGTPRAGAPNSPTPRAGAAAPGAAGPEEQAGPQPPGNAPSPSPRLRRDQILAEAAGIGSQAWTGPAAGSGDGRDRRRPIEPEVGIGGPSLPSPIPSRGGPAAAIGEGAPSRPVLPSRPVPQPRPVPPLPAPPSGSAAARRLLAPPSPPAEPPVAPPRPAFPARPTEPPPPLPGSYAPSWPDPEPDPDVFPRPVSAEAVPADEVLWSATTAAVVPRPREPLRADPPERDRPAEENDVPAKRPESLRGARFPRAADTEAPAAAPTKRVRVVLSERKGVARPVRTVVDVQEGTAVGELLRSNLIGSQLSVALRFAIGVGVTLGALPLLFALFPEIGRQEVLGLRLPWLLLGIAVYPFLFLVGWWHTRMAERVEQNFADHVQD